MVAVHGALIACSPSWLSDWSDSVPLPLAPDLSGEAVSTLEVMHRGCTPARLTVVPLKLGDAIVRLILAPTVRSDRPANRFSALIESLPFAVGVHRDLHFIYVNPAACRFLGYKDPAALVGKPIATIIPKSELAEVTARVGHMMATGEPLPERTTPLLCADGKIVAAELSAFPLRDFDGITSYVVVARDVTEHRIYEARVQQAQRMEAVGRLAGGIAHDFNNILSVILSYADILTTDLPTGSPQQDAASEIRGAALRAADMTRRLLMFSRGQPDGVAVSEDAKIITVIDQMMSLLRRLAGREVAIVVDAPDPDVTAQIAPTQLEQVVMNLVINARDAMPSGGQITITADTAAPRPHGLAAGAFVCVSVADTGFGMSESVRARAFEPFFSTKGPGLGTGMGLATVFGIAQQAGGIATLESAPGRGTTVNVWLRVGGLATPPKDLPPSGSGAPEMGTKIAGRVIVVEDDHAVRIMMGRVLRRAGYDVVETSSAEQALESIESSQDGFQRAPDLLITDVVMGECSGPSLVLGLRQRWLDLPVLFVSGYTDDMLGDEHTTGGETMFLGKPFTPDELLAAVATVLQQRELS